MIKDKTTKKTKLKRFMALYQIRLKDQDPNDLPDWEPFKLPEREEETEEFRFFGELKFE